ncbi:MAG: methyltransferase domain-containing protein [Acidobacteriota bacterium]
MVVEYKSFEVFPGWAAAPEFFANIFQQHNCTRVLEVGSGCRPTFSPDAVRSAGLSYVTSDRDPRELERTDPIFERRVLDLSSGDLDPASIDEFDCVFSRMVGEHVRDGGQHHRNIYRMLAPGGISAHCFSTLYAVPFIINRLLPDTLTGPLLEIFGPRGEGQGKFPAYYSWSRGPSPAMIRRFQQIGFEVLNYTGYFGHGYYRLRLGLLEPLEVAKAAFLVRHPAPLLCSYATLILRKPLDAN